MNDRRSEKCVEKYLLLCAECVVSAVATEGLWLGLQANVVGDNMIIVSVKMIDGQGKLIQYTSRRMPRTWCLLSSL